MGSCLSKLIIAFIPLQTMMRARNGIEEPYPIEQNEDHQFRETILEAIKESEKVENEEKKQSAIIAE